ncbi:MAG TPA: hypothetical protein VMU26_11475 [Candidatus Polarisedimenticolia bacterium]|nr:hypothetical protein [Candidatus Polarisedimenticolia bacterium]
MASQPRLNHTVTAIRLPFSQQGGGKFSHYLPQRRYGAGEVLIDIAAEEKHFGHLRMNTVDISRL